MWVYYVCYVGLIRYVQENTTALMRYTEITTMFLMHNSASKMNHICLTYSPQNTIIQLSIYKRVLVLTDVQLEKCCKGITLRS